MSLAETISKNSFDINFFIFIITQAYILLDLTHFVAVSGALTILSICICIFGIVYILKLKREEPERNVVIDISKNLFLPFVMGIIWYVLYDASTYEILYEHSVPHYYIVD